MMLGLAIGDALGNTSEGMLPADRLKVHGEVRDYLPNRHAENRPVGLPSDDSQLAFWTLEHLVESGGLFASTLAQIFAAREIFGIGSAVRHFVRGMQEGKPWWQASARSAGNGALMRIAPVNDSAPRHGLPGGGAGRALRLRGRRRGIAATPHPGRRGSGPTLRGCTAA